MHKYEQNHAQTAHKPRVPRAPVQFSGRRSALQVGKPESLGGRQVCELRHSGGWGLVGVRSAVVAPFLKLLLNGCSVGQSPLSQVVGAVAPG